MIWITLNLLIVLPTLCLPTDEDCKKTEIVVRRLGHDFMLIFQLPHLIDEYHKYITERYGKGVIQNETQIHDLKIKLCIKVERGMDSMKGDIIYKKGNRTYLTGKRTEIFMNADAIVIKTTKLQKKDAGIYFVEFGSIRLAQKALIIAGKPTIIRRSPPDPVLKPEDNFTSIIQLECHSVSTSVGDCLPTLYVVWYKYGMRISDIDPISSRINVTVDYNIVYITCLATDYLPCFQRLLTTKYYDDYIEECNNVFETGTFIIKPKYPPIVKLYPDQREMTVNKNEYLKVTCLAKCHPECDVRWEKDYQGFESNGLVNLADNLFENDLVIENVNSSYEGVYVCLVNNTHGEVKKNFTLNVRETKDGEMNFEIIYVIAIVVVVIDVIIVFIVIMFKKYRKRKKEMLRSLEMREMLEEWKSIVREPKLIKLEKTKAWQKWMRKPYDTGAWKMILGSFETRKLKTTEGEVSLETMDVHHDKLLPESQDKGICVITERD